MKKIFTSVAMIGATMAMAQVGINNNDPKATLDVTAKTTDGTKPEGIIAPRLTGDQIKSGDTKYLTEQTGTIVYATSAVTGTPAGKTINITGAGYYYFDGAIWQKFGNGAAATGMEPWYDVATQTPATLNDQNIYQMGNVGVGTNTPTSRLYVQDNIIADKLGTYSSVSSSQNLNLGSITSPISYIAGTFVSSPDPASTTNFSGGLTGVRSGVTDLSSSTVALIQGVYNLTRKSGGTVNRLNGIQNDIDVLGNANATELNGNVMNFTMTSSAKQNNVVGNKVILSGSSSNVGSFIMNDVGLSSNTGNIDNLYGYHVNASLNYTNATNKWAFYNDANIPSYFKGYVGIGKTVPTQPLQVVRETPAGGSYGTGIGLWEHNNNTTSNAGAIFSTFFSKGTHAAPGDLSGGDVIGTYNFQFRAGGNWSSGNNSKLFSTYRGTGADLRSDFQFFTVANTATGAKPRMTIDPDGDVGIGEINDPTNRLHVLSPGGTADPVRFENLQPGAATDAIVVATSTGVLRKVPASSLPSAINTIVGDFDAGLGRRVAVTDEDPSEYYKTGASILLPPGKWAVNVTMLMTSSTQAPTPSPSEVTSVSGSSFWVRTSFVDSDPGAAAVTVNSTSSPYIQGSNLISGNLPANSIYSLAQGTIVINNTTAGSVRYYYVAGDVSIVGGPQDLRYFGNRRWSEDQIVAYKIN